MPRARRTFVNNRFLFRVLSAVVILLLSSHITTANADKINCTPEPASSKSEQKKFLLNEFNNQLDALEATFLKCCDSSCGLSSDSKLDYAGDAAVLIITGVFLIYVEKNPGNLSKILPPPYDIRSVFKNIFSQKFIKGLAANEKLMTMILPNIIINPVKDILKFASGPDKIDCDDKKRNSLHMELKAIKDKLGTGISSETLAKVCKQVASGSEESQKKILLEILKFADESNNVQASAPNSTSSDPKKSESNSPATAVPSGANVAAASHRATTSRRPKESRNTGWDQYCKGDGQDYCEFLIYAGQKAYQEHYTLDIGSQEIKDARIRFKAAADDAPKNPSAVDLGLIISVNGHELPGIFGLKKIKHGKPLGGPFDDFEEEVIVLPENSYQYFVNGDNEISYRLAGPVASWIVFKWSELTIIPK